MSSRASASAPRSARETSAAARRLRAPARRSPRLDDDRDAAQHDASAGPRLSGRRARARPRAGGRRTHRRRGSGSRPGSDCARCSPPSSQNSRHRDQPHDPRGGGATVASRHTSTTAAARKSGRPHTSAAPASTSPPLGSRRASVRPRRRDRAARRVGGELGRGDDVVAPEVGVLVDEPPDHVEREREGDDPDREPPAPQHLDRQARGDRDADPRGGERQRQQRRRDGSPRRSPRSRASSAPSAAASETATRSGTARGSSATPGRASAGSAVGSSAASGPMRRRA